MCPLVLATPMNNGYTLEQSTYTQGLTLLRQIVDTSFQRPGSRVTGWAANIRQKRRPFRLRHRTFQRSRSSHRWSNPQPLYVWKGLLNLLICLSLVSGCSFSRKAFQHQPLGGFTGVGRLKSVRVGARPDGVAIGEGAVWIAVPADIRERPGSVLRIDPETGQVLSSIAVGTGPSCVAVGQGSVWVSNYDDTVLSRINPKTNAVASVGPVQTGAYDLVEGLGSIWFHDFSGITKIDPQTTRVEIIPFELVYDLTDVTSSAGSVWALDGAISRATNAKVLRLDPKDASLVASIDVGRYATAIAATEDSVWVVNAQPMQAGGTVSRIDSRTNKVVATIPVGDYPSDLAAGAGAVWVGNLRSRSISRIDPQTNNIVEDIPVGKAPRRLAFGEGAVWFTSHDDGTLNRLEP